MAVKTMVVGDIHAAFRHLNDLILDNNPDVIVACGDFGYFPPMNRFYPIANGRRKIYFCDGNHENHWFLNRMVELNGGSIEPIELMDNVFYMPRGSTLELNGHRILFMGGAESIDKAYRTKGYDWFEEESITDKDIAKIPNEGKSIDVIVSHTAPDFIIRQIGGNGNKSSELQLRRLYSMVKPKHWYFGHMHRACYKKIGKTNFHGLNMVPIKGCWQWLENNGCRDDE